MRRVIGWSCIVVWLGCIPASAGQLPPEILVDKHLRQAERLVQENKHDGATKAMNKMLGLQREHGLEPVPEDHFRYARIWSATGAPERAMESLTRYLELLGRKAEHYDQSLDLLNQLETEKEGDQAAPESPATQAGQESSTGAPSKSSERANVRQPLE